MRLSRMSIAQSVTLFSVISTTLILALGTGFLYWILYDTLQKENYQLIADQADVVKAVVREHPDEPQVLRWEIELEGAARRFAKYHARVLKDGLPVVQSQEMVREIGSPGEFPIEAPMDGRARIRKWRARDGSYYLLAAIRADLEPPRTGSRVVHLAFDVTPEEFLLIKYRNILILVLLAGILASYLAGKWVAQRSLRPLREITEVAGQITATQLGRRIASQRWPRELQKLAGAFDNMLAGLEASFSRLSQFSADLAHELRTPITALRGEAEMALTNARTPEELREVLESSLEEFSRLSKIIQSLLFLARSENAETHLQLAQFMAREEINQVISFYEAVASEKEIEIAVEGDGAVRADRDLFRMAISNVMGNALHFTGPGGRIGVRIIEKDGIEIRIRDNGCGISPEHLPRVFDRFYRVDASRHKGGTGLGLAIVKSILEMHGGTVGIESRLGEGTEVTLRFRF